MADNVPWTSIRALSFDIYGTLIDQNAGIVATARASAVGPFLPSNDKDLVSNFAKYTAELERNQPTMRKSDLNTEALRRYAADLGVVEEGKLNPGEIDQTAQEFGCSIGTWPAFPDTVAALQRLRKHYKLIALSNIDHSSLRATLQDGFGGDPFDICYIAEQIGSYKPDLRNFKHLLARLKHDFDVEPEDLCHVAQSAYCDLPPTKQLAIRCVWVDRYDVLGDGGKPADETQAEFGYKLRVQSLGELADIVDAACGSS